MLEITTELKVEFSVIAPTPTATAPSKLANVNNAPYFIKDQIYTNNMTVVVIQDEVDRNIAKN